MKPTGYRKRTMLYVMALVFVLASILFPETDISAALVTIPNLFNTGVDADGNKLSNGAPELHFELTGRRNDAFVISDASRPGAWTPSRGQSAWIGPAGGTSNAPGGGYSYSLEFDLGGLKPSTAEISGQWAADNASWIYLNGGFTGLNKGNRGYEELTPFTINAGFIEGINVLKFSVSNLDVGATGLLVWDLVGTAAEVPIPGSVWLLGTGLMALLAKRRWLRG